MSFQFDSGSGRRRTGFFANLFSQFFGGGRPRPIPRPINRPFTRPIVRPIIIGDPPVVRPDNTVPTSIAGGIRPIFRPKPIRTGFSLTGRPLKRPRGTVVDFGVIGARKIPIKTIKSPPIAFVRDRIPDVELTRRTGLTPKPLTRKVDPVSRRSRILAEPAAGFGDIQTRPIIIIDPPRAGFGKIQERPRVAPAVIGERRNLTPREVAIQRRAAPRAVDPNLVRLRNRRSPRVPPVRKRLIGGGSFGGIRARGVGFTSGAETLG